MPTNDYIKRSDAISLIVNGNELIGRGWLIKELATLPAADVEPVRHGRWIPGKAVYSEYDGGHLIARYYDRWTCSVCNYMINDQHYSRISHKRCPGCGAKMDAEPPKEGDDDS